MRTDLNALKENTDIRIYYGEKMRCPFHDDHDPSLIIYPDHVHCFGCGVTMDSIDFIKQMEGVSFGQAIYILKTLQGRHYSMSDEKLKREFESQ
jgi:DNA primase